MQRKMFSRVAMLATLIPVAALAACKGRDRGATPDTTAAAGMSKPDTAMSSGAIAPAAPLSDANIAALIDEVNVGDSTLAAAALPKLTNSSARNFAKLMMGEHHGLHVKGLAVEKAQKITPELPASDPFKAAVEAEQSALAPLPKGTAYDSTYIAHEAGIHKAVIDWQNKNTPQNTALQQFMQSAKGVYQRHLGNAANSQKKLAGGRVS
jgi:predicted outer membrane protein